MNPFWKENFHDWWRIITDRGDTYGTLTCDGETTAFANDHCSLSSVVTTDDSGVSCRVDTVKNT